MGYRSLRECVADLKKAGQLIEIDHPVDPHLEVAEIHRRVYRAGGPALYFSKPNDCQFPLVSNLLGTPERARYLFRDTLENVRRLVELKLDPTDFWKNPARYFAPAKLALAMRPKRVGTAQVLQHETSISQLPQVVCWPNDGGAFITLPQVYTENPERPGAGQANLGMYRIQLSGGDYQANRELGLHYQIHRGIGVHHQAALRRGEPLRVNIFVGGPPAMNVAAVMPLPEGMSELGFAGALAGHRIPLLQRLGQLPIAAEADFCITGVVHPGKVKPEGPFGDHLGYYAKVHDFPVLEVEHVYHRQDAIWPFTVVGRPPQEDTAFGDLIHEITGPAISSVLPGVAAVHAVDAAGVHPLLLAIGSERYTPYTKTYRPQELLTQANAILGQGQLSLAKYLWIAAGQDDANLDIHNIEAFLSHMLRRVYWPRDLHFQTCTTIDTLDYSGSGLNEGSKVVIAALGEPRRKLPTEIPGDLQLPEDFRDPRLAMPGVLTITGPHIPSEATRVDDAAERFCRHFGKDASINKFPLIVLVDDSEFVARSLENFLWTTFTRSNPAADIHGIAASIHEKHWGCQGALVIDARAKPHHAPPLIEDPDVNQRVDALAASGGPLHGII